MRPANRAIRLRRPSYRRLRARTNAIPFQPLKPWLETRLKEVLSRTGGITPHISLVDPDTKDLKFVVAVGEHADIYSSPNHPSGQGLSRWAVDRRRVKLLDDAQNSSEWKAVKAEVDDTGNSQYA